jgi:hypothetical protein
MQSAFFTLDENKDVVDLMASTYQGGPPSWSHMIFLRELDPDSRQVRTLTVDEGSMYMVCWSGSPDIAIGNAGPFFVVS